MLIRGTCWTRGCELRQRDISEKTGVCWLLLFAKIAALRHTYKKDQKGISVIKERRQHNRSKACEENQNTEILTTRQWAKWKPWSAKQKFPRFATAVSRVGCIISPSNCKTPIPVHLLRRRALRHEKHQPCLAMPGIKPRWINILPYPAMEGFNAWTWCVLDLETQPPWLVVGGMAFPCAPSAPSFCLLMVLLEASLFLICQCQTPDIFFFLGDRLGQLESDVPTSRLLGLPQKSRTSIACTHTLYGSI